MLKLGINEKISNKDYHADAEYLSSSALKKVLKNSEEYYNEYVLGNRVSVQKNSFDEGSLVHAKILEPEVIDEEFAFYPGFTKRGKEFEAFKQRNEGKIIISESQRLRCEKYYKAYTLRSEAVKLVSGGIAEHTLCSLICGIPVKVRPDYINVEQGYIVDVKTSAFSVDIDSFTQAVNRFGYDLSAALYCIVAEDVYEKPFDFYFSAISKSEEVCEVFKIGATTARNGEEQVYRAISKLKKCRRTNNWKEEYKPATIEEGDYEILEV